MITDEEIAELPEDPELAFVEFERIMRDRLRQDERNEDQNYNADSERLEYMNRTIAAARVYKIEGLSDWSVPKVGNNVYGSYVQFAHDVDHFTTQIRIRHALIKRPETVGLDQINKSKIHHHIEQIRIVISNADLPEDKRDRLYEKLHRLAVEVDKNRTGLNAGMAVYIAICAGIGQGFEKLEPARRWVDSIATLMGKAKDNEDTTRQKLPSPTDRKRLEAPRKELPKPKASVLISSGHKGRYRSFVRSTDPTGTSLSVIEGLTMTRYNLRAKKKPIMNPASVAPASMLPPARSVKSCPDNPT